VLLQCFYGPSHVSSSQSNPINQATSFSSEETIPEHYDPNAVFSDIKLNTLTQPYELKPPYLYFSSSVLEAVTIIHKQRTQESSQGKWIVTTPCLTAQRVHKVGKWWKFPLPVISRQDLFRFLGSEASYIKWVLHFVTAKYLDSTANKGRNN
jgi:hypothetical protein